MKKIVKFISLLLSVCLIFLLCACTKVSVNENATVYLKYNHNDLSVNTELSENEAKEVLAILDNKTLYNDNPSCGFDEGISFEVDGKTYAIACDACCIIKDCSNSKFLSISQVERDLIEEIFSSYGGHFPCV